jgi:hypothetical protein
MSNDGIRTTSTDTDHEHELHGYEHETRTRDSMSKSKVGNPWKTGKTSSERKGIRATDRSALKRRDMGFLPKEKYF